MKLIASLLLLITLTLSSVAHAAIITFSFEGYIDYFSPSSSGITSIPGTNLAVDDIFTGSLTYDTNVSLSSITNFSLGDLYSFTESNFTASLTFFNTSGNMTVDISGTSSIDLYDDHCCNQDNVYFGRSIRNWVINTSGISGGTTLTNISAFRMAKDNSQFDFSQSPPTIPTAFDYDDTRDGNATNGITLSFIDNNGNTANAHTRFRKISSTATQVPESSTIVLLIFSFLLLRRKMLRQMRSPEVSDRYLSNLAVGE